MEKSTQNAPQLHSLAERLSHAIKVLDFKRNYIAASIGISPSALTRIAKGHGNPSEQTLKSLEEKFGFNNEWLRTGAGEPFEAAANRFIKIRARAEKGDPSSQLWLYKVYQDGLVIDRDGPYFHLQRDMEKADYWLEKAALGGESDALYSMGMGVSRDDIKNSNHEKAVEYFRTAADQGHYGAMIQLGKQYAAGKGVPVSDSLAIEWSARGLLKAGIDPNQTERHEDRITELLPQIHKRVAIMILEAQNAMPADLAPTIAFLQKTMNQLEAANDDLQATITKIAESKGVISKLLADMTTDDMSAREYSLYYALETLISETAPGGQAQAAPKPKPRESRTPEREEDKLTKTQAAHDVISGALSFFGRVPVEKQGEAELLVSQLLDLATEQSTPISEVLGDEILIPRTFVKPRRKPRKKSG